jgi:hypothetical protein
MAKHRKKRHGAFFPFFSPFNLFPGSEPFFHLPPYQSKEKKGGRGKKKLDKNRKKLYEQLK